MSQCEWEPSCRRHPLIRRASVTIPRYGPHSLGCKTQLPLPVAHRRLRLEHSIQTRRKVLVLQFSMNRPCLASTVAKRLVHMNRCHAGPAIQPYPLTKLFTRPPYCVEPRGVLSYITSMAHKTCVGPEVSIAWSLSVCKPGRKVTFYARAHLVFSRVVTNLKYCDGSVQHT